MKARAPVLFRLWLLAVQQNGVGARRKCCHVTSNSDTVNSLIKEAKQLPEQLALRPGRVVVRLFFLIVISIYGWNETFNM